MRKTRRCNGRNAEFQVINCGFYTREEITTMQRENFRSLLYDDFLELL
jgi:hypothetical protein